MIDNHYWDLLVLDGKPPVKQLGALATGDVDNEGHVEVLVGGEGGLLWNRPDTFEKGIVAGGHLHACLTLEDVDGDGIKEAICGFRDPKDENQWIIVWFKPGESLDHPWTMHVIDPASSGGAHDVCFAAIDGDGQNELIAKAAYCDVAGFFIYKLGDDVNAPWQKHEAMTGTFSEGIAVSDPDGDGRLELIAGQSWYRPPDQPGGAWRRYPYAEDYLSPRVVAADLGGDGQVEIIMAEGDATIYGPQRGRSKFGRVARCRPGKNVEALWEVEVLHDHLLDPHSLFVADFNGNGLSDLFVGELGDPKGEDDHPPTQRIYFNDGGNLVEHVIETGLGTHESKSIQIDGVTGIVGKPFRVVRDGVPRTPAIDSIHLWLPE